MKKKLVKYVIDERKRPALHQILIMYPECSPFVFISLMTHIKSIHFITLHIIFFTYEKIHKTIISLCTNSTVSIEHMLFMCPFLEEFWNSVTDWLKEIGYDNDTMSIKRISLGD